MKRQCLLIALGCFAISLLILLCGCASNPHALKWDTTEKVMLTGIIGAQVADLHQTVKYTNKDGYKEGNPITAGILGDEVSYGEGAALKAAGLVPAIWIAHNLPESHWQRKLILGIVFGLSSAVVVHNYRIMR